METTITTITTETMAMEIVNGEKYTCDNSNSYKDNNNNNNSLKSPQEILEQSERHEQIATRWEMGKWFIVGAALLGYLIYLIWKYYDDSNSVTSIRPHHNMQNTSVPVIGFSELFIYNNYFNSTVSITSIIYQSESDTIYYNYSTVHNFLDIKDDEWTLYIDPMEYVFLIPPKDFQITPSYGGGKKKNFTSLIINFEATLINSTISIFDLYQQISMFPGLFSLQYDYYDRDSFNGSTMMWRTLAMGKTMLDVITYTKTKDNIESTIEIDYDVISNLDFTTETQEQGNKTIVTYLYMIMSDSATTYITQSSMDGFDIVSLLGGAYSTVDSFLGVLLVFLLYGFTVSSWFRWTGLAYHSPVPDELKGRLDAYMAAYYSNKQP
jgi:hypothetical protein